MKKLVPPTLVALVLVALTVIPLPAASAQAGLVSSVISRMEKYQRNLRTLSADISMEKYNSQLRDADKFYGTVHYIPAGGRSAACRPGPGWHPELCKPFRPERRSRPSVDGGDSP